MSGDNVLLVDTGDVSDNTLANVDATPSRVESQTLLPTASLQSPVPTPRQDAQPTPSPSSAARRLFEPLAPPAATTAPFPPAPAAPTSSFGHAPLQPPTLAVNNAQLMVPLKPAVSSSTTAATWATSSDSPSAEGSREVPRHIAKLDEVVNGLRLAGPKVGNKGSKHYQVRLLKPGEMALDEAGRNSAPIGFYYADVHIDVPASRARAKDLGNTGYYELGCVAEPLNDLQGHMRQHFTTLMAHAGISGLELRMPLYGDSPESTRLGVRVFEFSKDATGRKTDSGVEVSKVQGDPPTIVTTNFADPEYLRYSGKARVVFSVSVFTVAGSIAKLVFGAKSIVMRKATSITVGGITGALSTMNVAPVSDLPSGADPREWAELKDMLRDMIESGVRIHQITNAIVARMDMKIQGQGVANQPPVYTAPAPAYTPAAPANTTTPAQYPTYAPPTYSGQVPTYGGANTNAPAYTAPTYNAPSGAYPLYQPRTQGY